MGTFDELVSSGKEFAQMLVSLQEGKDKDTDSINSSVSNIYLIIESFILSTQFYKNICHWNSRIKAVIKTLDWISSSTSEIFLINDCFT